ncbi:MAG: hypothetical protein LAN83_09120 [Acidobacteriia bacterium]|nr:hypothetical protein [Terriglobia bacterium]
MNKCECAIWPNDCTHIKRPYLLEVKVPALVERLKGQLTLIATQSEGGNSVYVERFKPIGRPVKTITIEICNSWNVARDRVFKSVKGLG